MQAEHRTVRWHQKNSISFAAGVVLVTLCAIPSLLPLFREGYFPMHDDTQVVRVVQMADALADGQFPVRWVEGLGYGYGYPIFNFYSPLPYYIGGFLVGGFTPVVATKIMFGLGLALSGITMFVAGRKIWGFSGGILSAVLYLYAPYHAVNVYIRGAVGEYWAMAFLPLVLYAWYSMLFEHGNRVKYALVGALGYAGVILSHNITAMLTSGILVIVACMIVLRQMIGRRFDALYRIFLPFSVLIGLGLGLSAFFWIPALAEMDSTQVDTIVGGGASPADHFITLGQLWDSPWGYAGSGPGTEDGMSFKLGKLHIALACLGLLFSLVKFIKRRKDRTPRDENILSFIGLLVVLTAFSVFMTHEGSIFIWDTVQELSFVQFPWRFLVFITGIISILGAGVSLASYLFKGDRGITSAATIIALVFLTIFVNAKYFRPERHVNVLGKTYRDEQYVKWHTSKISDEYLPKNFPIPQSEDEIAKNPFSSSVHARLSNVVTNSIERSATIDLSAPGEIVIHTAYFPGWTVLVDGTPVEFFVKEGLMTLNIPAGRHHVSARFNDTGIRTIANTVSLTSAAAFFGIILLLVFKPLKKTHNVK